MTAARVAWVVPIAFAADALAARALMHFAPAQTTAGLAQPIAVATNWNLFGGLLLAVLAIATATAAWAYLRLLALLREGYADEISCWFVAALAALATLCAWFAPVIFSSDVFAYGAYGEMARVGIDPYSHATLPAGNAIFAAAIWQWGNPPPVCVYGPVFVGAAAAALASFAPFGPLVQLDGLRALACLALLLCALAAYAAYPGKRRDRVAAAATIALNPVAIWCAVEGHNDALALAVVLAGFVLLRRGAAGIGAAIVALAGSVKAPGLAAALPLLLAPGRARIGAIAGIAVTLALAYPLVHALATDVVPGGHYAPQASLQAIFGAFPALAAVAALVACAFLVRAGVVRLKRRELAGWVYLALAAWVLVPNPYPWYGIWLVAVAALAPGTRAARASLLLSFASLLRYLPDVAGAPNEPLAVALGAVAALPFAALL